MYFMCIGTRGSPDIYEKKEGKLLYAADKKSGNGEKVVGRKWKIKLLQAANKKIKKIRNKAANLSANLSKLNLCKSTPLNQGKGITMTLNNKSGTISSSISRVQRDHSICRAVIG